MKFNHRRLNENKRDYDDARLKYSQSPLDPGTFFAVVPKPGVGNMLSVSYLRGVIYDAYYPLELAFRKMSKEGISYTENSSKYDASTEKVLFSFTIKQRKTADQVKKILEEFHFQEDP